MILKAADVTLFWFFVHFFTIAYSESTLLLNGTNPSKCRINLQDLSEDSPLIFTNSSSSKHFNFFYLKPGEQELVLDSDDHLNIFCPLRTNSKSTSSIESGKIMLRHAYFTSWNSISVICIGNDNFKAGKIYNSDGDMSIYEVPFRNFYCYKEKNNFYGSILRPMSIKCGLGYQYEVGFQVGSDEFLKTYDLCYTERRSHTYWSHYIVQPIAETNISSTKWKFKKGDLFKETDFSYDVETMYRHFLNIFDSNKTKTDSYFSLEKDGGNYLVEGQLVSLNDKFHGKEKESTFFYANVVPIWKKINDRPGNWDAIGSSIRQHASRNNRTLEVWSGAFDVLKLGGERMFLFGNKSYGDENLEIPVPKYLYKCVVDKEKKEAICLVVINNPYLKFDTNSHFTVCNIIECNIGSYQNITKFGYTYCCELRDFFFKNEKYASLNDLVEFIEYKILRLP